MALYTTITDQIDRRKAEERAKASAAANNSAVEYNTMVNPYLRPSPQWVLAGALDSTRNAAVGLLGGDTEAPTYDPLAASKVVAKSYDDTTAALGRAGEWVQDKALAALGASRPQMPPPPRAQSPAGVRATSPALPPVVQPTMGQSAADYSAAALDGWQAPSLVGDPSPSRAESPAPRRNPEYGSALTPEGSTMQAQARGNYNMQNTDRAALAARAAPTAGINFGFGGGGETASQYLARKAAEDNMNTARNMAIQAERTRVLERSRIESRMADAVQSGDPIAIRGLRAQLDSFDGAYPSQVAGLLTTEGALVQQAMQAEAQALTAQQGLLGAQARAGATLDAAQVRAGGVVQAAQMDAAARIQLELLKARAQANTPEGRLAARKVEAIESAWNNGDQATAVALLGGGRPTPTTYEALLDPVTGKPIGYFNPRNPEFTMLPVENTKKDK